MLKNGMGYVPLVLMVVLCASMAFSQSKPAGSTVTSSYSYDRNGQLVTADYGSSERIIYVYDAGGNMIQTEEVTTLMRSMRGGRRDVHKYKVDNGNRSDLKRLCQEKHE